MKNNTLFIALITPCLFPIACWSATAPEEQMAKEQQPVVSELGRRRIQENLSLLDTSISDIKQNLQSTRHNVKTIQAELTELLALEREHLDLRRKYSNYISFAKNELSKNENTVRDLAKWEEQQKTAGEKLADKQLDERVGAAKREVAERTVWKADAASKTARVQTLIREIEINLKEIRSRKLPLERQLASWSKRLEEYETLFEKTTRKRKELESLAKR
jgi:chromosome segregation ATPase